MFAVILSLSPSIARFALCRLLNLEKGDKRNVSFDRKAFLKISTWNKYSLSFSFFTKKKMSYVASSIYTL